MGTLNAKYYLAIEIIISFSTNLRQYAQEHSLRPMHLIESSLISDDFQQDR